MSDIVKKLREMRGPNVWEAADEIERLEKERDETQAKLDRALAVVAWYSDPANWAPHWDHQFRAMVAPAAHLDQGQKARLIPPDFARRLGK